ncbi:MAG: hypothetical protein ABIN58_09840, partial [candidate division WOR-3 bacterium]
QAKLSHRADFISVDVDDPAQQDVVSRYGADRSPIPLTLVIAPNGAVSAGFPNEIKKTDFSEVFVSDGLAATLKVLQSQKLAAVCVQGLRTKHNKTSFATAEELKADPALGGAVEIVKVDPSDRSEANFMKMCQVDTRSTDAQLLVLAPPVLVEEFIPGREFHVVVLDEPADEHGRVTQRVLPIAEIAFQ